MEEEDGGGARVGEAAPLVVDGGLLAEPLLQRLDPLDAYRAAVAAALTVTGKPGHATLPFRLETPRARALISERLGPGEQLTVARYRRALARHLTDRRLWERAAEKWRGVLTEAPNDAGAHFALGLALDGVAATDQAIEAYRRAVALDGRSARFRLRLAQRLWETDQYYQAINEWRTVTAQEPENLEAGVALARAWQRIGERIEAFREYQRVLQIAPDNGEARRGLAGLRGRS